MKENIPPEAEMDLAIFPRPSPMWNVISVLSPVLVGFPVLFMRTHPLHDSGWGWGAIGAILLAIGSSCLVGLTAAIIALRRRERLLALTVLGFLVNGFPVLWFLFGIATAGSGRGAP
jgi:hypothetical protein